MTAGFDDGEDRLVDLDDVVVNVSLNRYDDAVEVLRLDLVQLALDDKSYVDLGVDDAIWLASAVLKGVAALRLRSRPVAGVTGPIEPAG